MSMLKYPLYEFMTTAPSCVETTTVKRALEIFEQGQYDRLVVLNEGQCPIGLLYSARLLTKFLTAKQVDENSCRALDLQQPLSAWRQSLIEPIQILPGTWSLEQLNWFLRSQPNQNHTQLNWALIDSAGKFLGIIDGWRLVQFLTEQKAETSPENSKHFHAHQEADCIAATKVKSRRRKQVFSETSLQQVKSTTQFQAPPYQPLVKLLEILPWPLMLLTNGGEIVTQNPAWWQLLEASKDPEGIRKQVEAILTLKAGKKQFLEPDKVTAQPSSKANHCFLDSQQGHCTCVVPAQDGQERVWQFTKIPLEIPETDTISKSQLWLILATDVTEQQQLSKELAAKNADLIQLNRLKDEFLACISHELKTPLTAVLGLSRLLADQQLGKLNERQARYAGLIHQSGRHLMSVVNDILDLTRMESGQMELMLANVKIRTVCERAIAEAKAIHVQNRRNTFSCATPMSPAKEHQFSLVIEPGLEDIIADEFRLRQMLVHLISNALKFTETGGEIGVRVNRWEGWIAFTVWDTGIGIPEHQQHLIFQKFQQLENPLTRKFEGTGLGLVLTRALARLHGGDVSFLSREGQGSQFTLLLPPTPPQRILGTEENKEMGANSNCYPYPGTTPLAACSSQELVSNSSSPAYRNNLVLVVEAVARYIEDLTEMLTGLGYRVVIARSGCEAVEKARRLQPKAIFLNPLLPLLSGWDVLTLLKSDPATRSIPVIVTATGAEKEQAIAHCADGFLSLPLQEQILAPILENLCHTPEKKQQTITNETFFPHTPPLRILRLIDSETDLLDSHRFLQQHRVIEVNDIEQAEILARVWQFDVVLLDVQMPAAETYLQQIKANPRLASLPLVTRDVATTQAASQIPGLSVFPCLTKHNADPANNDKKTHALLSVLQIAAGMCCPPCVLVVDLATLPELAESRRKTAQRCRPVKDCSLSNLALEQKASVLKSPTLSGGSEWFQALIQYLQTAGLKATMSRSWTELLQQLRHESVDLLLICLGETKLRKEVLSALQTLEQLPFKLPPVLVLDRRLHSDVSCKGVPDKMLGAIACQILPRSTSMEDLLKHIHQALTAKTQQLV